MMIVVPLGLLLLLLPVLAVAAPIRLMAIGDSVTHGSGSTDGLGFRHDLYDRLTDAGVDLLMVGSGGSSPYRGHFSGGKRIRQFYPRSYGNGWGTGTVDVTGDMLVLVPQIALIHLGTNDINSYHTPFAPYSSNGGKTLQATAAGRMAELVSYLLEWNNGTRGEHLESIILSRIIPMNYRDEDVREFNAEIDAMVEDFVEGAITGRPERLLLVDPYARFMSNPDLFSFGAGDWMDDDLHPNDAGYEQMAELYTESVLEALRDFESPARPLLALGDRAGRSLLLEWPAPGDDGNEGRALHYDLRFSTEPISESSFLHATRVLAEPEPLEAGRSQTVRIGGLERNQTYHFALRAIDNAANLSPLALLTSRTTEDAGYATDTFARDGIGEAWSRSLAIRLQVGAAVALSGDADLAHLMVYTPATDVGAVEIVLGGRTTTAGAGGVGVALRLDRANSAADGYAVVRDGEAGGRCRLLELRDGRAVAQIDDVAGEGGELTAGDRLGVRTDEVDGAYRFRVYVNGRLDAELTDTDRRLRSSEHYGGFILAGGARASVERINLLHPAARAVPESPELDRPGPGWATGLRPELTWLPSLDPNVGETVRYTIQLSTSPTLAAADSVADLELPLYTPDEPLDPVTTYYWRVRAYDTTGHGSLSAIRSFVTTSGAAGVEDADSPRAPANRLEPPAPNPFNPRTRIAFQLTSAAHARLSVFDVLGRQVALLIDRPLAAGEHSIWWDGQAAAGRRLGSGVYLLRLEVDGKRWQRKVVLAR